MRTDVIYADGAALNNPLGRNSAAAVLVRDGKVIERHAKLLGTGSNNIAEYHALLMAFMIAKRYGMNYPIIRMDSNLVVEQVLGRWKCKKNDLIPLRDRAQEIMKTFESVDLAWIPREENVEADAASMDVLESGLPETLDYDHMAPFGKPLDSIVGIKEPKAPSLFDDEKQAHHMTISYAGESHTVCDMSKEFALGLRNKLEGSGWKIQLVPR